MCEIYPNLAFRTTPEMAAFLNERAEFLGVTRSKVIHLLIEQCATSAQREHCRQCLRDPLHTALAEALAETEQALGARVRPHKRDCITVLLVKALFSLWFPKGAGTNDALARQS